MLHSNACQVFVLKKIKIGQFCSQNSKPNHGKLGTDDEEFLKV